jgi:hypothetical protein
MEKRPPLPDDVEVFIESYDPQGRATYVSGHFDLKKTSLRYLAILMEEYGGPNVAVTLPDETSKGLSKLGLDYDVVEEVITVIQRKIMEGAAHIQLKDQPEEKPSKP